MSKAGGRPPRLPRPPPAHLGQAIARRLDQAIRNTGLSVRRVAAQAECTHPTIIRILDGLGLPDTQTLIRLEVVLGATLWPADLYGHFTPTPHPPTPAP
ncbi:helix-turn-helix domain-containing protein [Streptomyces sp. NPDC005953]|uniref:helix-turn-helix domain-containing protein n=1 Tax=Streptomyces sp. NPDC005953 TaxID=3156719 RepID=UPI0033C9620C